MDEVSFKTLIYNKADSENQYSDNKEIYYKLFKRGMDIIFSFIGLIISIPIMIIFGLAIKIETSGNIIYKQERMGEYGN